MHAFIAVLAVVAAPNWVDSVPDAATFESISRPARTSPELIAGTKFVAPASSDDPSLLPVVYKNVNVHEFHLDFLVAEFPERFAGTSLDDYRALVERRATRKYFAGVIFQIRRPDASLIYGFDFYTDPARDLPFPDGELPTIAEIAGLRDRLAPSFSVGPLAFAPQRSAVVAHAKGFLNPPFEIWFADGSAVDGPIAYTTGTAYGRLRLYTLAELGAASDLGDVSWQDIAIVDEAPLDLTSPVGAVVTGTTQTELSHLSLRLAQRRTPNSYVPEPRTEFAAFEGELVRVDVSPGEVTIVRVDDPAEAEEWWSEHRPRLPSVPEFDLSATELIALDDLAKDPDATSKYGAKASQLALLRNVLPPEHVVDGFAVPFSMYERFLTESRIVSGGRIVSYADYLTSLLEDDERFRTDPRYASRILDDFVEAADDHGAVPDDAVDAVVARILATWSSTTVKVRFRSSSNYEDIIPFNGAGLYESTSGCAADSLDADGSGPSRCDAGESNERTLERAFRRVWSSLWLPRAFRERDYWQAPQRAAKMGILVTEAFEAELANGVVLTGNPSVPGDDRYVINVQLGEESVVHPDPGVLPEKIVLAVAGGVVTDVDRVRPSTLVPAGTWILSVDEAREIGTLVAKAAEELIPRFESGLGDTLLDLEFKLVADGASRRIVFKQVRPFLRESREAAAPVAYIVPPGTVVCGSFREQRSLADEHRLASILSLVPGRIELPRREGSVSADLIAGIVVGPDRVPAAPEGAGRFVATVDRIGARTYYRYEFRQSWSLAGVPLEITWILPSFIEEDGVVAAPDVTIDERYLSLEARVQGRLGAVEGDADFVEWTSCTYSELPLFEQSFIATSGERVDLVSRFLRPFAGTGPERLIEARVALTGAAREEDDYWRLVYSADHHNWNRRFWIFLAPPIDGAHVVELLEPERDGGGRGSFRLLDADFQLVRTLELADITRRRLVDIEDPEFLRGDVNVDASVDIADAIALLGALFGGGAVPTCADAADADDDGRVRITDAVRILLFLFGNDERYDLPWPTAWRCGKDLDADALPACEYSVDSCF
jgi:pyruvate,water dikinase